MTSSQPYDGFLSSSSDFLYPHTFTSYTQTTISLSMGPPQDKMAEGEQYEEYEEYELPKLPSFDYDSEEPLVIAANEAEVEEEDYYYEDVTTEDFSENVSTEDFSDDVTTKISVETSETVVSNIPDQEVMGSMKDILVTKDDFTQEPETTTMSGSNTETTNSELKLLPEGMDADTELHQEVLLKLRDKIKFGKHWLADFTNQVKDIKKSI